MSPPEPTSEADIMYGLCVADGAKTQSANKNGKKSDSGSSSGSFFTWFIVLALLGVWTSVAVVYFDLVDYQGVLGEYTLQVHLVKEQPSVFFLFVVFLTSCILLERSGSN